MTWWHFNYQAVPVEATGVGFSLSLVARCKFSPCIVESASSKAGAAALARTPAAQKPRVAADPPLPVTPTPTGMPRGPPRIPQPPSSAKQGGFPALGGEKALQEDPRR